MTLITFYMGKTPEDWFYANFELPKEGISKQALNDTDLVIKRLLETDEDRNTDEDENNDDNTNKK